MKELYKALAAFQQEVPVIFKDTQGYGYSYADLPAIFENINPVLKKYNLGYTQPIRGKQIITIIFHTESGECIEGFIDIPEGVQLKGMNEYQVLGSAITYLRRYALSSALGLVTDKDTDANGIKEKSNQETGSASQTTQPASNLPWLNENDNNWKLIVQSINEGKKVTIAALRKRFKMNKATQDLLTKTFNIK